MKRLASVLFLFLVCSALRAPRSAFAADLVISNNAIIVILGDSLMADTSGAPSTGYRIPDYLTSYFMNNYPGSNVLCYSISGSGRTMTDVLTNGVHPFGLGLWGYQSNDFQHVGIVQATDNAGLTSNQMYLAMSNVFQAPAMMSDGNTTLDTQTGWAATHPIQWIGLGDPPANGSDGGPTEGDRSFAAFNAGQNLGVLGVNSWFSEVLIWTNDIVNNSGNNIRYFNVASGKDGHIGSPGELDWTFTFLSAITHDTNISSCTVDWTTTSPVATNHCVVSSISKSGNTLTFTRHDDRLPLGWDAPNALSGITNDCTPAFALNPANLNAFYFGLQITNLPPGNYAVQIDGVTVANLPNTALAAGWNMFTNTFGPYWDQRAEGLGRIRDRNDVNRITLIPASGSGNGHSLVSYGSEAFSLFQTPGNRGNTLIAALDSFVASVNATNTWASAATAPTNHTFSITLAAPRFAPFHR